MTDELSFWLQAQLPANLVVGLSPLQAEASFRSFYRVTATDGSEASWVLMTSPPDKEQNVQFETLAGVFADADIPVPKIIALDPSRGWYLLTDLGPQDLEASYTSVDREAALEAAIDTLVALQSVRNSAIPPYTAERLMDELGIFETWLVGNLAHPALPDDLRRVFQILVDRTQQQIQCCIHRDYHCRNLLFNAAELGIVDFQDALIGPVSYDLASLLHDCYYEFSAAEIQLWTDYYLTRTPFHLEPAVFRVDLDYMAIQRQLKAVGIFARLQRRDGKSSHLKYIEPVLNHVASISANYTELKPLTTWLAGFESADAVARLRDAS